MASRQHKSICHIPNSRKAILAWAWDGTDRSVAAYTADLALRVALQYSWGDSPRYSPSPNQDLCCSFTVGELHRADFPTCNSERIGYMLLVTEGIPEAITLWNIYHHLCALAPLFMWDVASGMWKHLQNDRYVPWCSLGWAMCLLELNLS